MEKRLVLFLILSLLIIFGWNYLLDKTGMRPVSPEAEESRTLDGDDGDGQRGDESRVAMSESRERIESSVPMVSSGEGLELPFALEETVEIETELYRAEISSRGGVITSWELNQYSQKTDEGPMPVQLVYQEGQFKSPLSVVTADETRTKQLADGIYHVERDFSRIDEDHPVGTLTLTYVDPEGGVRVEKELRFHHGQYLVDVRVRTEGIGEKLAVVLGTNFGIVEWGEGFIGLVGPAFLIGEELEKETPDEALERTGAVRWLALQDKYFMSVFFPQEAEAVELRKEGDKLVTAVTRFGRAHAALELYAGPKQYDTLKAMNVRLEETIDFGWFIYGSWDIVRAVAKPLFFLLRSFHGFTGNYGLAIILLTICIKLLFVPLQYKAYKSMKDMQGVQPKVVELQKKYKDDRNLMNQELMKLYRDHKVNPVGGCLPMLLQMPVFIALFNILYMTVDLRQAPLALWIQDLSVPDPFYILPILMGVSMVVQQKIMPTTMDPTQAKMMLMLPVFLTFIFLQFASGLVLYWLTNNVLTITQQFVTDRFIFKKPTFSSLTGSGGETPTDPVEGDGQQPSGKKKKKDKKAQRKEADTPVES